MTHKMQINKDYNPAFPFLESFINFPPTVNSRFCTDPMPETMCESVDWSIKVGFGVFSIEIFVGNPNKKMKVDIKVNGEYIANNQVVQKGKLMSFQKNVESIDQYLIFTSECEVNCDFSQAIINAIEITPMVENTNQLEKMKLGYFSSKSEEDLCGGRRPTSILFTI